MDTFIVRLYRHTARSANEPAGTIEHVESGDRVGFASASELLDRLLAPRLRSRLQHRDTTTNPSKPRTEP
jgi:hypothetical protein